jgi:hypothetical protein
MRVPYLALCVLVFVCAGCAVIPSRPPLALLAEVDQIRIVPMESPPIWIDEWFSICQSRPDRLQYVLTRLDTLPSWDPAIELSLEAARQLIASGRPAKASTEVQELPTVEATGLDFESHKKMRVWYNSDLPSKVYERPGNSQKTLQVEFGVVQSVRHGGVVQVSLFVKLFDTRSNKIIGRWIDIENDPLPTRCSAEKALEDDAKLLRTTIARLGNAALIHCLQKLGLLLAGKR